VSNVVDETPLARVGAFLPGWMPRPSQERMAAVVARALQQNQVLLVDAPTGVGKSLGVLAPLGDDLARHGGRAAYATATIALQEQLVRKDVPRVLEAFNNGFTSALKKGMGRYLCLAKWRPREGGLDLGDRTQNDTVHDWVERTETGDQAELAAVPAWWREVAADSEDCLGAKCHAAAECFALGARAKAEAANLAIENQHLLLFETRFAKPEDWPRTLVFDEAHKLEGIASSVFGARLTDAALRRLLQRIDALRPDPKDPLHGLVRAAWVEHEDLIAWAGRQVASATEGIAPLRVPGPRLERYVGVAVAAVRDFLHVLGTPAGPAGDQLAMMRKLVDAYANTVRHALVPDERAAQWIEQKDKRIVLRSAPIDVGPSLAPLWAQGQPRVLMSATLAHGNDFAYVRRRLGIGEAACLALPSAFDHARQVRYFLPAPPLDPADRQYVDRAAAVLRELLLASRGRALVLFTSYRHLEQTRDRLEGLPYRLLVADRAASNRLAEEFREDVQSVLLGTARYWEGIDVPGEALSLLAIMRLPFEVPAHPLVRARYEAAERAGENPFTTIALPETITKLRQGVGRLIRTVDDCGVVALLDGRIETKRYGATVFRALPRAPIVRTVEEVRAFLAEGGRE